MGESIQVSSAVNESAGNETAVKRGRGRPRRSVDETSLAGFCGTHLRNLRESAGLTVYDYAELAGLSVGSVYQNEAGVAAPSMRTLFLTAKVLKLRSVREAIPDIDPNEWE